jgi:hypothetical protein
MPATQNFGPPRIEFGRVSDLQFVTAAAATIACQEGAVLSNDVPTGATRHPAG